MSSLWLASLTSGPGSILLLLGQGFWLWMLIDCLKAEGPRSEWRYILFFGNVAGAFAYFVVRWLPYHEVPLPKFMLGWKYKQRLWNAKAAAHNIGNPHQYAQLGDLHLEMGNREAAATAYARALETEPKNIISLWGMAQIAMQAQRYEDAKSYTAALLAIDPQARFGEASLLYAKAQYELKEWDQLRPHLETDIQQWSHPESSVMLATILLQSGDKAEARDRLETMMARVQASPQYHHRRHQPTLRKAQRLLKSI
jgi:tetratricopeptide (TPR) repeat protein